MVGNIGCHMPQHQSIFSDSNGVWLVLKSVCEAGNSPQTMHSLVMNTDISEVVFFHVLSGVVFYVRGGSSFMLMIYMMPSVIYSHTSETHNRRSGIFQQ